ncbi:MAG: protein kinase [Proteobacteria bacterium]|nr:protein kinase [Pseudomonadota bacterium]MCP4917245.1 protein kinase [Pseudomonadota bacterium]
MSSSSIGPFRLTAPLGRGAAAEVYRGTHASGLEVAVKVQTHDGAAAAKAVATFRTEVRAVARLDHPNVVKLYELGGVTAREASDFSGRFEPGAPWLAMELCEAEHLGAYKGTMPWPRLRSVLLQLLDALGHAHANGLVHRDVKPGNVLLSGDRVVLSDFGLALPVLEHGTELPSAGTPAYMAPEQLRGEWRRFSGQTDLYAVGSLAWTMLTGEPPFGRKMAPAVQGHLNRPLPRLVADAPQGVEKWLRFLMAKDPDDRPASAAHAAAALLDLTPSAFVPFPTSFDRTEPVARKPLPGLGLYALRPPPLVGRLPQREKLWHALGEAIEGKPQVVVLSGPAGVGKSRLAAWLCTRAHELAGVRSGRAVHGPQPSPRSGLTGLVRRQLRAEGLSGEDLHAQTRIFGLADWLEGKSSLAPMARHALVREALDELTVTWLDDVQWGEEALQYALAHLADEQQGLLLLTVQDEGLRDRPRAQALLAELAAAGAQTLPIEPLADAESQELVSGLLGLEPSLAQQVHERAGGIPLFAVELVGEWVQDGALVEGPDGLALRHGAELPADLAGLWRTAVRRLLVGRTTDDGLALEVAAALGTSVEDDEWLDACTHRGLAPSPDLREALVERGLAIEDATGWSFAHGLLRDAILESATDVSAHNAAAAAMLGERIGAGVDERYALHLLAAGMHEEALRPLVLAAQEARARGDTEAASRLLDLHVVALDNAEIPPTDPRRGDTWAKRASLTVGMGDVERAQRVCQDLLTLARHHGWRRHEAVALRELSGVYAKYGRHDEAVATMEEGLDVALELADEALAARAWWQLGLTLDQRGDRQRAVEMLARAVQFAAEGDDPACEAGAHLALANVQSQLGNLDVAEHHARQALGIHAQIEIVHGQAGAYNSLGEVARMRGDLARAEMRYRQARRWFLRARSPDLHVAELNLASTLTDQGDPVAALQMFDAALAGLRRSGWTYLIGGAEIFRLPAVAMLGDWDELSRGLQRAESELGRTGFAHEDCRTSARRARELTEAAGQIDLAVRCQALEDFQTEALK